MPIAGYHSGAGFNENQHGMRAELRQTAWQFFLKMALVFGALRTRLWMILRALAKRAMPPMVIPIRVEWPRYLLRGNREGSRRSSVLRGSVRLGLHVVPPRPRCRLTCSLFRSRSWRDTGDTMRSSRPDRGRVRSWR